LEKAKSSSSLGEKDLPIVPFVFENKKKRKLQEKSSDPSVDGLGFPKMFDSPEQLGKAASQSKSLGKDSSKKRQEWFKLYTTWPKYPERGYITGIQKEDDKKVLIVEVTKKMSQYYQDIVADIRDALEKESITKEEAVSMRSELLLAYNSAI